MIFEDTSVGYVGEFYVTDVSFLFFLSVQNGLAKPISVKD